MPLIDFLAKFVQVEDVSYKEWKEFVAWVTDPDVDEGGVAIYLGGKINKYGAEVLFSSEAPPFDIDAAFEVKQYSPSIKGTAYINERLTEESEDFLETVGIEWAEAPSLLRKGVMAYKESI